jgi:hypothetical protein
MGRFEGSAAGAVAAVIAAAWLAAPSSAQRSQPAATGQPTIPYLDKAFGFEIQVPAGWNYDRSGFFGPGGSLGLLRGTAPGGHATLQILVFREMSTPPFPEWIESFSEQLGGLSGVERVRVKGEATAPRPAAYVLVEARRGVDHTRTSYYCVQFDANTIWVFAYATVLPASSDGGAASKATPDADEVEIPAELTRLTRGLRVFYDPQVARQTASALQRGKEYLARYQLQEDARRLRIDESVRYYEIRLAGKPIGYLTRRFTRESEPLQRPGRTSNPKEGLRVRERSYRFADDGTTHVSRIDLFSSRDGETDLYELSQARVPPPESAEAQIFTTRDQCVREGEALFSTYTTSRDQTLPDPRPPIKLEASYLGLAWVRLLPALLGPEPGPMHAFTIYDSETRTVITYGITPLGEKTLPGSAGQTAYAFETRAGFVEKPGMVYTDADGNMVRFEAGDLVLELSDERAIEERFGARRDAANARLLRG